MHLKYIFRVTILFIGFLLLGHNNNYAFSIATGYPAISNDSITPDSTSIAVNQYLKPDTILDFDAFVKDTRFLEMLDSMVTLKFYSDSIFVTDSSVLNVYGFPADSVPVYSDSVYEARIAALDRQTPIGLTFNRNVKNFIKLYANKRRGLVSRILGLAEVYFPLFEEELDR